jgi:hypothetical protein
VFDSMTEPRQNASGTDLAATTQRVETCMPEGSERGITWKLPLYQNVQAILTNPVYAGEYAFGKTETRTTVVDGRARRRSGHRRPRSQWMILIPNHHPGYLFLGGLRTQSGNDRREYSHAFRVIEPKSGRSGRALLSGLLRCRQCGRMLYVTYSGPNARVVRYECCGQHLDCG